MSNHILKLCAVAAMSISTPAMVSAQIVAYSTSSPVAITSFSVDELYAPGTLGGAAAEAPEFIAALDSGYIELKFINQSEVPATVVKFSVNDGRYTEIFVDKGTFSPGALIKHTFPIRSGVGQLSNPTCNVAEVEFADGSSWHIAHGDAGTAKVKAAP